MNSVLTPAEHDGLIAIGLLVAAALAGFALAQLVFRALARLTARRSDGVLAAVVTRARAPSSLIVPLAAVEVALPYVSLPEWSKLPAERTLGIVIIAAVAWAIIAVIELGTDLTKRRYRLDEPDNLRARQVETRLDIIGRSVTSLVLLIAVSAMLMTFPAIRAIGATLLASAGLAGIVAGLAARPILENLVAGLQIALTQPIRIDDVVIVETEFGRVEKITATYVVVRLWDLRRMVVPLTYFIDHPFQNWTYSSANLIGSVFLYLDYSVPVEAVRGELPRVLARSQLWDGSVSNVAMTDAKEGTVELRVLVSARSAGELFDLRCFVREALIGFVRERFPDALPGTRVQLSGALPVVHTDGAAGAG